MKLLLKLINQVTDKISWLCVAAVILLVLNVFIDVVTRYFLIDLFKFFNAYAWYDENLSWLGGIGMQELEKHWFAFIFLIGLSYTLKENAHIRVDVFYDRFPKRTQSWVNLIGTILLALPFTLIVLYFSWNFFFDSWSSGESKGDPGSLPRLWPFKLMLPVGFFLLATTCIGIILKEFIALREGEKEP